MENFIKFMQESYSNFHATKNVENILLENGYIELEYNKNFNVELGKKYFVNITGQGIIAFNIPNKIKNYGMNITSQHLDSPTFKLKPIFSIFDNHYQKINVETYGGTILSSWLDTPLSIAGRVSYKDKNGISSKLVYIDKDLLFIPNIAPHLKPEVSKGVSYNAQIDLQPLLSNSAESLLKYIAKDLKINENDILEHDLYLTRRAKVSYLGLNDEFIVSPKIDDLACCYTSLIGFIKSDNEDTINVYCAFDSEEVGSRSEAGASSRVLDYTLTKLFDALKINSSNRINIISNSIMLSCDNGHAINPNHPEVYDNLNKAYVNEGILIKYNANKSYQTQGLQASYLIDILNSNNIKYQKYSNRSDIRGGSTLSSLSLSNVTLLSIDIGLPQLSMHSSMELCGKKDVIDMIELVKKFYNQTVKEINKNSIIKL